MSTKTAVLCLMLVFSGALCSSRANLQASMGFLYMSFQDPTASDDGPDSDVPGFLSLRVGMSGDLLFPVGSGIELGGEIGFYGMPIGFLIGNLMMIEIPIDALVRINLTTGRKAALELRGGMWLSSYSVTFLDGESASISDARPHIGGRLVLGPVYFGADYILQSKFFSVVTFEAGLKFH